MVEAVRYIGDDETGDPVFDLQLSIPDRVPFDPPPTQRMVAAVHDLFGDIGEVTASQAHAILSARDYGRQCARRLVERQPDRFRDLFARLITVFILVDEQRLADVLKWSHRRFDTQPDGSAVARTKRFPEVKAWLADVIADADAGGARWGR